MPLSAFSIMNQQLRAIIDELYALDPSLRAQEKELIPILEKLLARKPKAVPDEAFVQRLRVMLRDKAASPQPSPSFFSFLSMYKLNYAVTGAVLGAIVTGPIVYSLVSSGGMTSIPVNSDGQALFSYSVEETNERAFGDLSAAQQSMNMGSMGGMGGGGGVTNGLSAEEVVDREMDMSARPQSGGGGGDAAISDKMMIYPVDVTEYTFVVDGKMPTLTDTKVDVLKRQKGMSSPGIGSVLSSFNTGLVDLSTFENTKTDSINFYEDKQFGYMFYLNFREGSLAINQNWTEWPHPEASCRDEACFNRFRLNINDVPSDDVLISIAQDFADEHGFDLSNYGTPEVDNNWRGQYEIMADKSQFYIPDTARVVFPQIIDGKNVYDEGGGKAGISFGISIREKRVADAWGIMDQKFLKSAYGAVTDSAMITDYLKRQGEVQRQWMPEGTTVKTATVTLGTPEMGYMKTYSYNDTQATSEELLVPALIFPVTSVSDGSMYYRSSVTVPLTKEMIEQKDFPGQPIPLMEDMVR
jgi:hypothetical protein